MNARILSLLALAGLAVVPALARDRVDTLPVKTWDLLIPGEKEPEKLPVAGTLRDNWDLPDKVRTGYVTTKEQLADLWKALGQTGKPPEVDFAKETIVLIDQRALRIRIETGERDKPILSFAISATKGVKERHYTLMTFPKDIVETVIKEPKK
jgi:hypothetical protein